MTRRFVTAFLLMHVVASVLALFFLTFTPKSGLVHVSNPEFNLSLDPMRAPLPRTDGLNSSTCHE